MRIAFDFDETLFVRGKPNDVVLELLRRNIAAKHWCIILTARNVDHEHPAWWSRFEPSRVIVSEFLIREQLPVEVVYLNHACKAEAMQRLQVWRLYDNESQQLFRVRRAGLQGVLVDHTFGLRDHGRCETCGQDLALGGVLNAGSDAACAICRFTIT